MNFSGDAYEWYRCFKRENNGTPPWSILVEEISETFKQDELKNPIKELKKIHQTGKVEDYIRNFQRAKSRLYCQTRFKHEQFYIWNFICGLKEEIQHTVDMFEPNTLNQAYNYARKAERSLEGQEKRNRVPVKPTSYQNSRMVKFKDNPYNKWQGKTVEDSRVNPHNQNAMSYEQKKALGLCFKCNEKYHAGHKCAMRGLHALSAEDEYETDEEAQEQADMKIKQDPGDIEDGVEEDQAVITMCAPSNNSDTKTLKLKGYIGNIPICALIDSGSTHSFINPAIVHNLEIETTKTTPLTVRTASGDKMSTNQLCESLSFFLQKQEFEGDVRVLDIRGYDMILGMDWLATLGPLLIDCGKGTIEMTVKGKKVNLAAEEVKAEIRLCEQEMDVIREKKKGNQVIFAHLFSVAGEVEPRGKATGKINPRI